MSPHRLQFTRPQVVGTITTAATLAGLREAPCDLVEIRLDLIGAAAADWRAGANRIAGLGYPTILTVRLAAEGGRWDKPDETRAPLFATALDHLAGIDIELRSQLLPALARTARLRQKLVIVSHHDFERTPGLEELQAVVGRAAAHGTVVKVATMINRDDDIATLRQLLASQWPVPLCVIGMGDKGVQTRVEFAALGSCLTYGYLDAPSAPGQPSASELSAQLSTLNRSRRISS